MENFMAVLIFQNVDIQRNSSAENFMFKNIEPKIVIGTMTILPAGPIPTDVSGLTNDLSGLTPTLKPSGVLILYKVNIPLSFNVGPVGKNGLTTFLG